MKLYSANLLRLCLFIAVLSLVPTSIDAQTARYCYHQVRDIEWSPDGEQLAVMTSQGAVIYDPDLNLIRIIEAPDFGHPYDGIYSRMLWSPDSQWIILPELYDPELYGNVGGYHGWVIANAKTGELRPMSSFFRLHELAWSPNNQFILALRYDPGIGLDPSFSELSIRGGIREESVTPISRQFEDIEFQNIQWHDDNTISVQYDNITIYLDTNLELLDRAPTIDSGRMVSNVDGTLQVGMSPQLFFIVREIGEEEQVIDIDGLLNADRELVAIGVIDEIFWVSDEQLLGIYGGYTQYFYDETPDLYRLLQGVVVNARTAILENQFLIEAESDISGYSVSIRGDRIALYHSETMLELWNPLTEDRLALIEIPALTSIDDC